MFKKKGCEKCGKSIKDSYEFCPNCGNSLGEGTAWGMLGKNDRLESDPLSNSLFGGGILNKMLGNAMKVLEKELQKELKNSQNFRPKTNLQLYINGKKVNIQSKEKPKEVQEQIPALELPAFSTKDLKKFSSLPKKEPKTNIRRLSDKVIYEISMPGVKSIEDISITKLENSIEIKAISKSKVYYKIIQIGLPIIDYKVEKAKLVLELEAKN